MEVTYQIQEYVQPLCRQEHSSTTGPAACTTHLTAMPTHEKQITVVFAIHRKPGCLRSVTGTRVGPLDEVTFWL